MPDDEPDTAARPTTLGALVLGLAATAFAAAFALGTLIPALLGLLLVALGEGARRDLGHAQIHVTRKIPQRAHLGDPFTVTVTARGPPDHPLRIDDPIPHACLLDATTHHEGRGRAERHHTLTARIPGTIQWTHTDIEVSDPWSLWARRQRIAHTDRLKVSPEPIWTRHGHLMARRAPTSGRRRSLTEHEPSPEIDRIREYHPGDRVRDIDWKRSSRSERLHVRETQRKGRRVVHILLEATPQVRWARRHAKATTLLRILHGTAGHARAAGLPIHLVAYHERGVMQTHVLRPDALGRALDRLTALPIPTTTDRLPDRTTPRASPTPAEARYLRTTAPLATGPWPHETPNRAALLALTDRRAQPGLVVAFLDAESDPEGTIAKVRHLVHHGHKVLLVTPPTGAHLYTRDEAHGQVLMRLKEHLEARRHVAHTLHRLNVPLISAAPGDERLVLQEVSKRLT